MLSPGEEVLGHWSVPGGTSHCSGPCSSPVSSVHLRRDAPWENQTTSFAFWSVSGGDLVSVWMILCQR